jgi:hypothetical protein
VNTAVPQKDYTGGGEARGQTGCLGCGGTVGAELDQERHRRVDAPVANLGGDLLQLIE